MDVTLDVLMSTRLTATTFSERMIRRPRDYYVFALNKLRHARPAYL